MADEEMDYRPRPERRGRKAERPAPRRPQAPVEGEVRDYAPLRPARAAGRPPRREKPPRRGGRSARFLRNKWFWRAAAVFGLIVLVGVPVVAELTQGRGVPRRSLAELQAGLQQNPNDFGLLVEMGDYYGYTAQARQQQGDTPGAVEDWDSAAYYYERALDQDPAAADVRAKAAAALTTVGNAFLDAAEQWRSAGDITTTLAMLEQAVQYYERARVHDARNANLLTDLGIAYLYQGEISANTGLLEQAVQIWQKALSYSPDKPETLYHMGNGYADLGQVDLAIQSWQRVIEVSPGSPLAQEAQDQIARYSVGP